MTLRDRESTGCQVPSRVAAATSVSGAPRRAATASADRSSCTRTTSGVGRARRPGSGSRRARSKNAESCSMEGIGGIFTLQGSSVARRGRFVVCRACPGTAPARHRRANRGPEPAACARGGDRRLRVVLDVFEGVHDRVPGPRCRGVVRVGQRDPSPASADGHGERRRRAGERSSAWRRRSGGRRRSPPAQRRVRWQRRCASRGAAAAAAHHGDVGEGAGDESADRTVPATLQERARIARDHLDDVGSVSP